MKYYIRKFKPRLVDSESAASLLWCVDITGISYVIAYNGCLYPHIRNNYPHHHDWNEVTRSHASIHLFTTLREFSSL